MSEDGDCDYVNSPSPNDSESYRALQAQVRELERAFEQIRQAKAEDGRLIERQQDRITALSHENAELTARTGQLEADLADAIDLKNGCGPTVLTAMKQRITALEADIEERRTVLGGHLRNALAKYDEAQQRITQLEDQLVQQQGYVCRLEQRITALEAERDEWKSAAQLNKGAYEPLQQRITQLSRENEELTSRTRQLEGALKEERDDNRHLFASVLQLLRIAPQPGPPDDYRRGIIDKAEHLIKVLSDKQAQHALASGAYKEWCRDPTLCQDKGTCPLDPTCAD
jgi:chromosome segregation ATPase